MSFYKDLNHYYDQIFPLNEVALDFILENIKEGDSILDIGAGTGNMAIALAERGYKVTASEPEETMAQAIMDKAKVKGLPVSVHTKPMEQINDFAETFDQIVCMGNTLPHLPNMAAVTEFLQKCYEKLNDGGKLLIQQVNYDKVLSSEDFSFPVIEKEDFTFTRIYEKRDEHILFTTRLTVKGETTENTIPLYPITSEKLKASLAKAGFKSIRLFGNFKKAEHTILAPALVVVAEK